MRFAMLTLGLVLLATACGGSSPRLVIPTGTALPSTAVGRAGTAAATAPGASGPGSRPTTVVPSPTPAQPARATAAVQPTPQPAATDTPAAPASGPTASVDPGGGTLRTTFTFSVTGMTPGHGVLVTLTDGAGNRFTYQKDGVDQAIVVDTQGNASLQVTPATDLPGSMVGAWRAVFTEEETGYTATVPFDITP